LDTSDSLIPKTGRLYNLVNLRKMSSISVVVQFEKIPHFVRDDKSTRCHFERSENLSQLKNRL
jgi:hypothetical protein